MRLTVPRVGQQTKALKAVRWRNSWALILAMVAGLCLSACGVPHGGNAALSFPGLSTSEVTFHGDDGVILHGTVVAPAADGARKPAIVLVQGAGPVTRGEYRAEAEAFARRGIVTLVYDKRTVGYSSTHRDYSELAGDALAGTRLLHERAGVDPAKVGIWGLSEGAWVAVLAADRSPDVAFVITAGAVGVSPSRQQAWSYGEYLRHAGVSGSLNHMMQTTGVRQVVGAGLFPEASYDPVPSWEHLRQPVLALWGSLDREAAPRESSQIIGQALRRGGNTHATIRFIPGARHSLRVTANGGFDRPSGLAPGSADLQASWIKGQPVAGSTTTPQQDRPSTAVTTLDWYESSWGQLGALVLFAVAFLGYPLTAAAGKIRRRRGNAPAPAPTRRMTRLLTSLGGVTVLGGVLYFFFLVLTATNIIGPVVAGQTVPWLLLHLLAIATVIATGGTAVTAWRHRAVLTTQTRLHLGLLLLAGTVFVPWALYWGLLSPSA